MGDGKKALVTGGAGFIGSHMVDRLLEAGYEVAFSTTPKPGAAQLQEAAASPGSPGLARLKAELEGMKLGALSRRAMQLGVDASALDAAEDTDDPKAATIQLILVEQALLAMP